MPLTKVQGGLIESTNEPVILGAGSSTGTASQPLQVTGGAYFNGSVGIGTTNPSAVLDVFGGLTISVGDNTASSFTISRRNTNSALVVAGGPAVGNNGANIELYGSTHATEPNRIFYDALNHNFRSMDATTSYVSISTNTSYFNNTVLIGSATSTGTASQTLQVTGGAYVSGSVGIGSTIPKTSLDVLGEITSSRVNATQEGGQINFARAIDNQNAYSIDCYNEVGFGLTPKMRFIDNIAGAERVSIDKAGNFLIGLGSSTGTASQPLQVNGGAYFNGRISTGSTVIVRQATYSPAIQAVGTSDNSWIGAFRFATAAASCPQLMLGKSQNDTVGSYTAVSSGQALGAIAFHGTNVNGDSSNNSQSASIVGQSAGNFTATSAPGSLLFSTTPVNSTNTVTRMIIFPTGNIGINTSTDSGAIRVSIDHNGANQTTLNVTGNQSVPGDGQIMSYGSNNAGTSNYAVLLGVSDTNGATWQSSFRNNVGASGEHRFYSWTTLSGRYTSAGLWYNFSNTTTWNQVSDIRIKKNIKTLENGLNVITSLRPVEFDYKKNDKHEVGFISQEYEQVLPEQVISDRAVEDDQQYIEEVETEQVTDMNGDPLFDDNGDPVTTSYKKVKVISQNLVPYLVSAIKEQQAIIESLTARIKSLEDKSL